MCIDSNVSHDDPVCYSNITIHMSQTSPCVGTVQHVLFHTTIDLKMPYADKLEINVPATALPTV